MREKLQEALAAEIIATDLEMLEKTKKLIVKLDSYRDASVNEEVLSTVLKTQQIVKDIVDDGSSN